MAGQGLQQQGHQPARRRGLGARRCPRRTPRTCAGRCTSASTSSRSASCARADDAADVRKVMAEEGISVPVIAKIEKPQALDNIDAIVDAFDGIMVARGDLGVECPLEDVPVHQKLLIDKARANAKPVIVATQMLESMISAPAPTRAEASDVANAVLDGADAVMLSGETSGGGVPDRGRRARWPASSPPPRTTACRHMAAVDVVAAHARRHHRQGGRRGRGERGRQVHRRLHRAAATRPGAWPATAAASRCSPSPPRTASARSCR